MKKYIPNIITIIRGILIIPTIILFLSNHTYLAGLCFSLAAISDFIDGYLARKWKVCSDFGRKADHVIDKYLSILVLAVIVIKDFINIYILVMEFLIMCTNWYMYKINKKLEPLQIGRIKTFFLLSYIILLLFNISYLSFFYFIVVFEIIVLTAYLLKLKKYKQKGI